jgi:hypothetical protein
MSRHGDVGGVQCPNLVGPRDAQRAQRIRIDLVPWRALAGTRLRRQRLDTHAPHQRGNVAPPDLRTITLQLPTQHACAHEGVLQVQRVNALHQRQLCRAGGLGQVVHRASTHRH